MKNSDLSKIRYIKLDKKASYNECWTEGVGIQKKEKNKKAVFYSYGFYDLLTCFCPSEYIDYMEHFHISPSFDKFRNTLKVEQWFGLFPVDQEITSTEAGLEIIDPFFCDITLSNELPFLGVILISLSNLSGNFKKSLGKFVKDIKLSFTVNEAKSQNIRFVYSLYYSLNCADLCLVIRTDSLNYIHQVNRKIKRMAEEDETEINTTVIFSVQYSVSNNNLCALNSKNKEVSFIVRSDKKYENNLEEREAEDSSTELGFNVTSYGVNGTGNFVTRFNYNQYSALLPNLIQYKLSSGCTVEDESFSLYIKSICHEREWFDDEINVETKKVNCHILQRNICRWICSVREKIIKIDEVAGNFFAFSENNYIYKYKKMFDCEFRLIKDLVDTYSDLWYKNVSQSGYIFFSQICIAVNGIGEMLEKIKDITGADVLEQSVQNLYQTIHFIACDLNGYNKQFQYLNQDSVNFPSYEIQSKVNSEKYMAAYSSFLHRFFATYYQNKNNEEYIVQSFPLALIDITQRKIVTNLFFSSFYKEEKKKDNNKKRSLFSVHFPSAEYFANIWNSIPLLMHEVFHTLHYGETEVRNKALVYSVDTYFAETIVSMLLNVVNEGITINNSWLPEMLREPVYDTIVQERTAFFEQAIEYDSFQRFSDWRFREVKHSCQEFYSKVFDSFDDIKNISYKQGYVFRNKIKKDLDYILQCIDFAKICCAFSTVHDDVPKELYYAANALYLNFAPRMYHSYQQKYDSFFEQLKIDIDQVDQENLKQFFRFVAYQCKKFDQNNKLPEVDEIKKYQSEDDRDNWYWLMEIVLVAGMISLFEKYQPQFSCAEQEDIFIMYCKDILPKPYYDNVGDYARKMEKVYQDSDLSDQNKRILKNLFHEYFELYASFNNLVRFLADEKLSDLEEMADDTGNFIKALHMKCYEYIHELIKGREYQDFNAVFTRTNREQLVKLGLIDEEVDIFKKIYESLLSKVDADFVKDIIADRVWLFKEVYADCGMCLTIGFDFFGYCMFSLSNHNTVNDFTATNEEANFLADRIRAVAGMYFTTEGNKDLKEAKTFIAKLFDKEMIQAILQMLYSMKQEEQPKILLERLSANGYILDFSSLKETKGVFRSVSKRGLSQWIDDIIAPLLETLEKDYQLKDNQLTGIQKKKISLAKEYLFNLYSVLELFYREDIFVKLANQRDPFNSYFYQLKGEIMNTNTKIPIVKL